MTTEIWYLFLTSMLLAVLWIPFIAGQVSAVGVLTSDDYKNLRDVDTMPAWIRRANRAHVNLVEQFGAFAGLVVVAHLTNVSTTATALAAAVFFWSRIAHAVVMITGIGVVMLRTLIFSVAWACLMVIGWEILTKAG